MEDDAGERRVLTLRPVGRAPGFVDGLEVAAALQAGCGLGQVVAPQRTRDGALFLRHDRFTIALFPYLTGSTAEEQPLSAVELEGAAALIAGLHGTTGRCPLPPLPEERFGNQFVPTILRALRTAGDLSAGAGAYRRRVSRLLLAEQTDLIDALGAMTDLAAEIAALPFEPVLTHGDPNLANILRDAAGMLHLIDWSAPALGPPERDLFSFTEVQFEDFLRHYLALRDRVRLHAPIFAFYAWRWTFQEIADYATRILFHNTDPAEDEHAWTQLQPYLPIPHDSLRDQAQTIAGVLTRVVGR